MEIKVALYLGLAGKEWAVVGFGDVLLKILDKCVKIGDCIRVVEGSIQSAASDRRNGNRAAVLLSMLSMIPGKRGGDFEWIG